MKIDSPAACRFFTVDDAVQWAIAAYYGASRAVEPPSGEAWWIEGEPWATPDAFADEFHHRLTSRINRAADEAALPPSRATGSLLCWGWKGSGSGDFCESENARFAGSENAPDNQAEGASHGALDNPAR